VSPEVEPVNQQVRLWAEFDNPEKQIRPGLVATMEVKSRNSKPDDREARKGNTPPSTR
jgi:multidrug efflux pump subunit AcrA (membrane-fusion protein)